MPRFSGGIKKQCRPNHTTWAALLGVSAIIKLPNSLIITFPYFFAFDALPLVFCAAAPAIMEGAKPCTEPAT